MRKGGRRRDGELQKSQSVRVVLLLSSVLNARPIVRISRCPKIYGDGLLYLNSVLVPALVCAVLARSHGGTLPSSLLLAWDRQPFSRHLLLLLF